jgi:hypothetical protein
VLALAVHGAFLAVLRRCEAPSLAHVSSGAIRVRLVPSQKTTELTRQSKAQAHADTRVKKRNKSALRLPYSKSQVESPSTKGSLLRSHEPFLENPAKTSSKSSLESMEQPSHETQGEIASPSSEIESAESQTQTPSSNTAPDGLSSAKLCPGALVRPEFLGQGLFPRTYRWKIRVLENPPAFQTLEFLSVQKSLTYLDKTIQKSLEKRCLLTPQKLIDWQSGAVIRAESDTWVLILTVTESPT